MPDTNQLQIPAPARNDRKSWIANGEQHISLRAGIWDDPAAWGVMLADLAGHIANTFEQSAAREHKAGSQFDRAAILAAIREGFEAELSNPSDELSGEISGELSGSLPNKAAIPRR